MRCQAALSHRHEDSARPRSHGEYVESDSLIDMIREDMVADRIATNSRGEIIRFFGDKDITARR
jgi:bacterioferritin